MAPNKTELPEGLVLQGIGKGDGNYHGFKVLPCGQFLELCADDPDWNGRVYAWPSLKAFLHSCSRGTFYQVKLPDDYEWTPDAIEALKRMLISEGGGGSCFDDWWDLPPGTIVYSSPAFLADIGF